MNEETYVSAAAQNEGRICLPHAPNMKAIAVINQRLIYGWIVGVGGKHVFFVHRVTAEGRTWEHNRRLPKNRVVPYERMAA